MKLVLGPFGRRRSFRRLRDDKGANIVEAAIMTPLLLLLTFAIVDFSSMFYAYLALEHGVSQATRLAITGRTMNDPNTGAPMDRQSSIKQKMRDSTPTLTIPDSAFTFNFMAPGSSTWQGGLGGPGDIGRVTVTYNWTFMTPLIRPFFTGGAMTLRVQSTMKNEAVFN
jgi:Flp pilus assembly protein TadG